MPLSTSSRRRPRHGPTAHHHDGAEARPAEDCIQERHEKIEWRAVEGKPPAVQVRLYAPRS